MKKIVLFAAIAAAVGFASCTAQAPKANLKNEVDTLSYMMGVNNTQGLNDFLVGRMGVDLNDMDAFLEGFIEASTKTSKKDKAYMAGLQIGQQVAVDMFEGINQQIFGGDSLQSLNKADFLAGFIAAVKGNAAFTLDSARVYVETHADAIKAKALESRYGENKAAGEAFLAENAKKEGIVTLPSGLQYEVITEGNGKKPSATDRVKCHYEGTLIDGTLFDSSIKRGQPAVFGVNQVIQGWVEALQLMTEGSKWRLFIPSELGYGAQQAGEMIPPHSTLIFEVELIEVL
jgi:FKBP-type peptidyl-prolyl cis-trans isomerase FklB